MSKKQLLSLSPVASIPATLLLLKLLFSLTQGLLGDKSSASVVLWIIYVVCLLGSAFIAFLPLLLWLYYPAAGFEGATAAASTVEDSGTSFGATVPAVNDDEDVYEEEESFEEDGGSDGEALFDEDAMDEDFDEFDGEFAVDDDK